MPNKCSSRVIKNSRSIVSNALDKSRIRRVLHFLFSAALMSILTRSEHRLRRVAAAVCRLKCVGYVVRINMGVDLSSNHFFREFLNERQVRNRAVVAYDIIIQRRFFFQKWSDDRTLEDTGSIDFAAMCLS